ncbi:MAG: hypothetical protein V2A73_12435 [Pseudomonadota bacterium]
MSVDERIAELANYRGTIEIDFSLIHRRVEELMLRPVWTHEFANFDSLIAEIRSGQQAGFLEVLDKLPVDKDRIIVVGQG